jgi:hypothetical protein
MLDVVWAHFVCDMAQLQPHVYLLALWWACEWRATEGGEAASASRGVVVVGDGWWESLKLPAWDDNKQPTKSHVWLQTQPNGPCMATGYINPCKPPTIFEDYPHLY